MPGDEVALAVTVALVEDHALVRHALRLLLEREGQMRVVGEAGDGEAGLRLIESSRPEVALVDVALPVVGGFPLAEEVVRRGLDTRIVFLTAYDDTSYLVRALEVGALGFVPKSAPEQELLTAIRQVAAGRPYVPPSLVAPLVAGRGRAPLSPLATLSPRERQVLELVVAGRTTDEIATVLRISPHTVHRHRGAVMQKLGFHDRVELVRFALANDLEPRPRADGPGGAPRPGEPG